MDLSAIFITTVSSSTLIAVLLWFTRNLLITRLTKSVSHEYDKKLTHLKADLDLRASEISSIQKSILEGVFIRQKLLYERKLNAIDQLWNNVVSLSPAKNTSSIMLSIPYEKVMDHAKSDPKVQEIFKMIDGEKDTKKDLGFLGIENAKKVRPYLSELSWALFSAYHTILTMGVMRMEMLKTGIDVPVGEGSLDIVKKALPHHTEYIEKYGLNGMYYLLEEIEQSILRELKRIQKGEESDKESIEMAQSITNAIKENTNTKGKQ